MCYEKVLYAYFHVFQKFPFKSLIDALVRCLICCVLKTNFGILVLAEIGESDESARFHRDRRHGDGAQESREWETRGRTARAKPGRARGPLFRRQPRDTHTSVRAELKGAAYNSAVIFCKGGNLERYRCCCCCRRRFGFLAFAAHTHTQSKSADRLKDRRRSIAERPPDDDDDRDLVRKPHAALTLCDLAQRSTSKRSSRTHTHTHTHSDACGCRSDTDIGARQQHQQQPTPNTSSSRSALHTHSLTHAHYRRT